MAVISFRSLPFSRSLSLSHLSNLYLSKTRKEKDARRKEKKEHTSQTLIGNLKKRSMIKNHF